MAAKLPENDLGVILVGRSGAGKSTFGRRVAAETGLRFLDSDDEIGVPSSFSPETEAPFREAERLFLRRTSRTKERVVVATGGGAGLPPQADPIRYAAEFRALNERRRIVWLRSEPEDEGPPPGRPILPTVEGRAERRRAFYAAVADAVVTIPRVPTPAESDVALVLVIGPSARADWRRRGNPYPPLLATSSPEDVRRAADTGLEGLAVEVRNLDAIPSRLSGRVRIALRGKARLSGTLPNVPVDWPVDEAPPPRILPPGSVVSWHGDLLEGFERLAEFAREAKLSTLVSTWREIGLGLGWAAEAPSRRTFLPRSVDGRWSWLRLARPGRTSFVRDAEGTTPDQPTLVEWLARPVGKEFAAVLSTDPSRSTAPAVHDEWARRRGVAFVRVRVLPEELPEAIPVLAAAGLRWLAIEPDLAPSLKDARTAVLSLREGLRASVSDAPIERERFWANFDPRR